MAGVTNELREITIVDETFGAPPHRRRQNGGRLSTLSETISVRDLIRFRVEAELEKQREARDHALERVRNDERIAAPVEQLNADAVQLRGFLGGSRMPEIPASLTADEIDAAVAAAHEAFEVEAYFLLVNGRQVDALDEMVPLASENEAVFLRLVPLKGG